MFIQELTLVPEPNQRIFVIADPHFGHGRAIELCKRPFTFWVEMNAKIINNINKLVRPKDTLIIAGDYAFGSKERLEEYRDRIYCENVILVLGNHDERYRGFYKKSDLFTYVCRWVYVKGYGPKGVVAIHHYPLNTLWHRKNPGVPLIHGHSHGNSVPLHWRVDAGVDVQGFKPVLLEDLVAQTNFQQRGFANATECRSELSRVSQ